MKNLHEHCSKPWVVPLSCLANRDSDGDLDWFRKKDMYSWVWLTMIIIGLCKVLNTLQSIKNNQVDRIEDPWGHYPQRGNMNLENPTCLGMILMIYINIDPREWESDGIWTKSRLVGWNTHPENMTCKLLCIILPATRNCYNCIQLFWHIRMHLVDPCSASREIPMMFPDFPNATPWGSDRQHRSLLSLPMLSNDDTSIRGPPGMSSRLIVCFLNFGRLQSPKFLQWTKSEV